LRPTLAASVSFSWSHFIVALLVLSPFLSACTEVAAVSVSTASGASSFTLSDSYTMVIHPLPTNNSAPLAIAVAPDGVVWFLEETTNRLGSYDPSSGAFQEFLIPSTHSTPQALISDAEGNIWFTELSTNKLAELPRGTSEVVEHAVPSLPIALGSTTQELDCGPSALAEDGSGNIWFTCLFSNQIDEYLPTRGTFASFNLPVFPSGPAGLAFDSDGTLWFTAADADMLGKATVSQLVNGTSSGISEFAPVNQTYIFEFTQQGFPLGGTTTTESSLPTPTGIALDSSGRLWITEHVDSSFDSYSPSTGSLVKYWTSQTHGAYGFHVTFPNGIAVAKDGSVWIAEHYGNRVAEFNPSSGQLTEYPACCSPTYGGIYSLVLANGTPWFVEVQGNSIGEMNPSVDASPVTVNLPTSGAVPGLDGILVFPMTFSEAGSAASSTRLALDISGISSSGALENMTASFSNRTLVVQPGRSLDSDLTLSTENLASGTYYLTLTASSSPLDVLHSIILKLTVTGGGQTWLLPALVAVAVILVGLPSLVWLRRRSGVRGRGRRVLAHLLPFTVPARVQRNP